MAEEDIEYHVTFPSPTSVAEDQDASEENLEYLDEQKELEKEPVVIMLGWVGCHDKTLAKYSAIYEKRGFITIRYTASVEDVFFNQHKLRPIALKLLELLSDLSLEDNPIFFHVFSNGGGFVYRYIAEILNSDCQYDSLNVRGTVFDSAPSHRSPFVARRAFMLTMQHKGFMWRQFMGLLVLITIFLKVFIERITSLFRWSSDTSFGDYWDVMKNDKSRWPQLYLYSKADELVNYRYVEEIIKHRKKLGVIVMAMCWEDSPHVQHFRVHREAYMAQVYAYVDFCLNSLE
ncbi:transmembrane protein 53-A [Lingula anatina]|uniref:Transmembrane protein 53-A n=1 Tax=Lingula anatina TaxID=7574 RepID=A0A1S3I7C6_LINAN|nr:transmembrane protein 53-A [Lingula anatina]|eukprot:XP_013393756.1 transmembrane protein 53-A [Lingula anatina]